MLEARNITLHYGGSQILQGIDLVASLGRVTCVMGPNGVGKTSLLKALTATHRKSGGTISLERQDVGDLPAHLLARRGVGYVPQGRMIFPLLTVRENLMTGFACLPNAERTIPGELFDLFPVLKDMLDRRGGDLSGGQQQQLAIARALVIKPKVLFLDEPTEGIQPNIIKQIGAVIEHLRQKGDMAIVLVEQYFAFAFDLADDFVVLDRGTATLRAKKGEVSRDVLLKAVSV